MANKNQKKKKIFKKFDLFLITPAMNEDRLDTFQKYLKNEVFKNLFRKNLFKNNDGPYNISFSIISTIYKFIQIFNQISANGNESSNKN